MAPDSKPARSQRSTSGGGSGSDCDDAMADASSTRISTPDRDTECTLVALFESYEIVETYLREKGAPESVQAELDAMVHLA
jgi:hypothetical protein